MHVFTKSIKKEVDFASYSLSRLGDFMAFFCMSRSFQFFSGYLQQVGDVLVVGIRAQVVYGFAADILFGFGKNVAVLL